MKNPFGPDNRLLLVDRLEDARRCSLISEKTVKVPGDGAVSLMDMQRAWDNFVKIPAVAARIKAATTDEKPEFSFEEIATIAGVTTALCEALVQGLVLTPSVVGFKGSGKGRDHKRRFSLNDGFIAGTVGALRRQGYSRITLKVVADRLRAEFAKMDKKRDKETAKWNDS